MASCQPHTRDQQLPELTCEALCCRFLCNSEDTEEDHHQVPWSLLTMRPGVYALELLPGETLTVSGCTNTLPFHTSGWALVLLQFCDSGIVQGLPVNLFMPGPRGHLVWRNSAVSDSDLQRAYELMDCWLC